MTRETPFRNSCLNVLRQQSELLLKSLVASLQVSLVVSAQCFLVCMLDTHLDGITFPSWTQPHPCTCIASSNVRSLQHAIQIGISPSSFIDVNGVTWDLHSRKSEHRWMINTCNWQQYREGQFHSWCNAAHVKSHAPSSSCVHHTPP